MILEPWEKEKIISEVISLATRAMFNHQYYTFGGRVFHQKAGGPIGLRGTCSISRLVMQLYDNKWLRRMEDMGVTIWLLCRYMDDSRAFLPEIKAGWRWESESLQYCREWEEEDKYKSGIVRTKEILLQSFKTLRSISSSQ